MVEKYFGVTDTGRVRGNNEDNFIVETVMGGKYLLACVIDGVGGYEGGEVAAEIAKKTILSNFKDHVGDIPTMLRQALIDANTAIFSGKYRDPLNQRMACVLTIAVVERESHNFFYAHVGDTRLYLLRDRSLIKISSDHSFVGFLEDSGRLTEAEAMLHPKRNEINKGLGFEDPIQNAEEYFEISSSPFLPGDTIMLCSDGLTDMVNKEKMTNILNAEVSLEEKAKDLVNAANEAGGKDNITVVLVQNDRTPVKVKATRPVSVLKPKRTTAKKVSENVAELITPVGRIKKPGNGMFIFLIVLCLLLATVAFWFWKQKSVPPTPDITSLTHTRNMYEQRLGDSLNTMQGHTLFLDDSLFGMSILLSDTLFVNKDSVHIIGNGSTIISSDTVKNVKPVIMINEPVRYILFDSLTLRNVTIRVTDQKFDVVHFNNVRLNNSSVEAASKVHFTDSIYTGNLPNQGVQTSTLYK